MIDLALTLAAALYVVGTLFLTVFVVGLGLLLILYLFKRHTVPPCPTVDDSDLPAVTVQLPVYNEPHVVSRLLDACADLDYPADRLRIQILDDSTDHTTEIIRRKLRHLGHLQITHLHRRHRDGYKAGALAAGLRAASTDYVAIFDADFIPPPDFLRRTVPHLLDTPDLALVQTRWSHLNTEENLLTRTQALNIDAHFTVEQVARSQARLPMSMNGTGVVWRAAAIEDAGGWSDATLTEDLDLSYRAYLRGWRIQYLPDVTVPGELPSLIQTYKTQQARWAVGSTQCLLRHGPRLVRWKLLPLKMLTGLLHLAQYAVQPVILLLFLLTPVMIAGGVFAELEMLKPLAAAGLIPPLVIAVGQMALYPDWLRRLCYFPVQFLVGAAIVLSNSAAVMSAILVQRHHFRRTPKRPTQGAAPVDGGPRLDWRVIGEMLLAGYALFGLRLALTTLPALAPYMLVYVLAFGMLAVWNIYQVWHERQMAPVRAQETERMFSR